MLTKKGNTRGNVSLLLTAAFIATGTRVCVDRLETGAAIPSSAKIAWQAVPAVSKDEVKDYFLKNKKKEEKEDKEKEPGKKTANRPMDFSRLFSSNKDRRPVLIFYTDENNILCQRMARLSVYNPDVRELIERDFFPVKIAFDKTLNETEYAIYRKYSCIMVPHVEVVSPDGTVVGNMGGYRNATELYKDLKREYRKYMEKDADED
ncbi:MAG: thioredoxin family protein [Cyanobacteria bacterium HKST-UBA02]|nr:thioredoxin family protein [Cyanobacteria bacterium HKST-UBA02]